MVMAPIGLYLNIYPSIQVRLHVAQLALVAVEWLIHRLKDTATSPSVLSYLPASEDRRCRLGARQALHFFLFLWGVPCRTVDYYPRENRVERGETRTRVAA